LELHKGIRFYYYFNTPTMTQTMTTTQQWKYYDFDANWNEFLSVWKTDQVQTELEEDMATWCENEAYYITDEHGNKKTPIWTKGEPLWHLSRTDYWSNQLDKKAQYEIAQYDLVNTFHNRLEQVLGQTFTKDLITQLFHEKCYDYIYDHYKPKPDTIDSLILVLGKNYISTALLTVAELLFPDCEVCFENHNTAGDTILIKEHKLVFDLLDYYYTTRDGDSCLLPDEEYEKMCL
jgi:hypothetical protein